VARRSPKEKQREQQLKAEYETWKTWTPAEKLDFIRTMLKQFLADSKFAEHRNEIIEALLEFTRPDDRAN
jgi:hypothetical protein